MTLKDWCRVWLRLYVFRSSYPELFENELRYVSYVTNNNVCFKLGFEEARAKQLEMRL